MQTQTYEPTEEEIREAAAEIRSHWGADEFYCRAAGRTHPCYRDEYWQPPVVSADSLPGIDK